MAQVLLIRRLKTEEIATDDISRGDTDVLPARDSIRDVLPAEVAATNVKGLTLTYLPPGNPTTVRVQLEVEETAAGNQNVAFTVGSDVEVRNL